MNFNFLDKGNINFLASPKEIEPNQQEVDELEKLKTIAKEIGSYSYVYNGTDELHDGIVAQELLKVPGLASAVHTDENGLLTVDTKFVALATLGYVSTLARLILGEKRDGE